MDLWDIAKSQARALGKSDDWAFIMHKYKELGGTEKSVTISLDNDTFELIGQSANGNPMVKSHRGFHEISLTDYTKSKKLFKSKPQGNAKLVPIKKMVSKDGKSFMQTFWVSPEEAREYMARGTTDEDKGSHSKAPKDEEVTTDKDKKREEIKHKPDKTQETKIKQEPVEEEIQPTLSTEEDYWRGKTAKLNADIAAMWGLQCRNLYSSSNLGAVGVREAVQNSRDAINQAIREGKTSKGKVEISWSGNSMTIQDNGIGMDVKTLHTKFLNLGGTTKGNSSGSVGGFGVAKAVILGCGDSWEIHTRNNYLSSDNVGKGTIDEVSELQGTKLTIHNVEVGKNWQDNEPMYLEDRSESFRNEVLDYLATSDIGNSEIYVQGKKVTPRFEKNASTRRMPTEFGIKHDSIPQDCNMEINVFDKPSEDTSGSYMYVRLGGLTQFKTYLGGESNADVVLDFDTTVSPRSENYPFTSSREGLKSKYSGILDDIRDTMTQNSMAVTKQNKYKETVFDNKSKMVKEQRKIITNASQMSDFLSNVLDFEKKSTKRDSESTSNYAGYDADYGVESVKGGDGRPVSLVDKIADAMKRDFSGDDTETDYDNNNPLDHAWIVLEESGRTGEFDVSENLDMLVTWDTMLRKIGECYTKGNVPEFYPGFCLEDGVLGMSIAKGVTTNDGYEQRKFIAINPESLRYDSDWVLAGHLRSIACHELAHAIAGNFEQHNEKHSYTREQLDMDSLHIMEDLVNLVKQSKIRDKYDKQKQQKVEEEKKKQKEEYLRSYKERQEETFQRFTERPNHEAYKELVYFGIARAENMGYLNRLYEDDWVTCVNWNDPESLGQTFTVKSINESKGTIEVWTSEGAHKTFKSSSFINNRAIDKIASLISYSCKHDDSVSTWVDNYSDYDWSVLISKYLPAYKMQKVGKSDMKQRVKSLSKYMEYAANNIYSHYANSSEHKSHYQYDPTYATNSLKSSMKYDLEDNLNGVIEKAFPDDTYRMDFYSDFQEHFGPAISKAINKAVESNGGRKIEYPDSITGKQDKPKKTSSKKSSSSKLPSLESLRKMTEDELYEYAEKNGVTGWQHYSPGIKRMRCTMAIKKQLFKSEESLVINLGGK